MQAGNSQNDDLSQRPKGEFADGKFRSLVQPLRAPTTTSSGKHSGGLLIVSHDASRTGASIIILSVTKQISKFYNLDVVVLLLKGGEIEALFKECANVYSFPQLIEKHGSRNTALKAIVKDLKNRNIHTALCNTVVTGDIVQHLKRNGFETISLVHELMTSIRLYGWTSLAESHSRNSDKIIFPAEDVLNSFKKQFPYKPERFILKPQGLQIKNPYLHEKECMREWLRNQYNISKNARIVLGCGFGDLRKGLDIFSKVANAVLSSENMACNHFLWVGGYDTNLAGWLNHDMEKRGFRNRFHLVGHQSDPFRFFAGSDLFLLTSREDPFPTVFMEAMDAGLPVIAFKGSGGAEKSLSDGSGIVVPYLSVDAMAEEVIQLLSNKNEMQRIAVRGAYKVHKDYRISDYVDFILQNFGSIKTVETLMKQNVNSVSSSQNLLNILILLGDFDVGGGQMFAIRLANSLADRCNVFCGNARPKIINSEMIGLFDERVKILDHGGDPVLLAGLIAQNDIDVINSHIWWADKLAFQVVRDIDVKWYITMHGCYEHLVEHEATDPMFPKIVKDMLERVDGIAYPADKNLQVFDNYPISNASKRVKIYYGLDRSDVTSVAPAEYDFGKDAFVTGIVSRAIPSKGWEIAIKTVLTVNRTKKAKDKTVHLVLVGNSPYANELREKYKDADTIHFVGYVNKPSSWIMRFDVGLLPTYFESESLPNTIIEYLACGKPTIATAIGEIPNMITKGQIKAGTLIPLNNHGQPDKKQLSKAIRSYMRDSDLLSKHVKNTDILFQQFSMKTSRGKYLRMFDPARYTHSISVVIPLYNHARYIKQTVQSVLDQSVPVDEIIIIDDGSTDRSAQIAKSLADEHYNIQFWSRANKGAHATINEGIEATSGDYIAILNSDDMYHIDRFEECILKMSKAPYPEVVFTRVTFLNDRNQTYTLQWYDDAVNYYYATKNLAIALLRCNFFMTTSNIFAKKDVFKKVGLFSGLRYTHDLDFFLRLLLNGTRISFLDKRLLHYRWHESNTISESQEALRVEVAANIAFFAERIWRRSNKDENSFEYIRKISEIAVHHKALHAFNKLLKKAASNDKLENAGQLLKDYELKESLVAETQKIDSEIRNLIRDDGNIDYSLDQLVSKHFYLEFSDSYEQQWSEPVMLTQDVQKAEHEKEKNEYMHISTDEDERLKKMPLIFSNPDWDVSGVNTFTETLIHQLINMGYNAKLIITSFFKNQKELELPNVPLEFLLCSNNNFRQRWSAFQEYLIKNSPCIYVPNYDFDMSAISPILPSEVGIVGIVHSDDDMHYDHVYRLGKYWNAIVCVSEFLKGKIAEINPKFIERLHTIHCGIDVPDLECNHEYNSEKLRIIYTGRIEERQKRVSDIPKIIGCLDELDVPYVFTIAGDGESLPKLKQELSSHMKNGLVRLLGRISPEEVQRELVKQHVFLLCSGFEGLPISLLEALVHGLVPVVSDIQSGIPEIVHDWENGFIVPVGDVRSFANRLKELHENREFLKAMSSSSLEVFRKGGFDNEAMTETISVCSIK